jgi:hypothetical protein
MPSTPDDVVHAGLTDGMNFRKSNQRRPLSRVASKKRKKEEFPGRMESMLPGNSFPQICVVSINHFVENADLIQEHGRIVVLSNLSVY